MSSTRLALVADDAHFGAAVASHLQKALGHAPVLCPYDGIADHLGPDTGGSLVLTVASPGDARQALRLIQQISLQEWPLAIVLVAGEAASHSADLIRAAGRTAAVLRWPGQASALVARLRQRPANVSCTAATPPSLHDVIRRRLLCWTPSLVPLVERLALAATHDVTVLLTGETGTGKTHLARLIHDCSPRCPHRFLVVPCGALAANLVESEFFGHTKGAFTGADRPKIGKFAAAGDGTLLLDEIDALALDQQANLLRVIETGEFEAIGSNETQNCTARIIVASNQNLEEALATGLFRSDLYYRLNVMSFQLPPLRERVRDIGPLVRGMAARFNRKFSKDLFTIHPDALATLEAFPWPGNIRQLENVVQQAVLVCTGEELLPEHLPLPLHGAANGCNGHVNSNEGSLLRNRETAERTSIMRALVNAQYSRARAASTLGISRVTLYKKMKKYGLMDSHFKAAQA